MKTKYSIIVGRIKSLNEILNKLEDKWFDALSNNLPLLKIRVAYQANIKRLEFEQNQLANYYMNIKLDDFDVDYVEQLIFIAFSKINLDGTFTVIDQENYPEDHKFAPCFFKCKQKCYSCGHCSCLCSCISNKYVYLFVTGNSYFFLD